MKKIIFCILGIASLVFIGAAIYFMHNFDNTAEAGTAVAGDYDLYNSQTESENSDDNVNPNSSEYTSVSNEYEEENTGEFEYPNGIAQNTFVPLELVKDCPCYEEHFYIPQHLRRRMSIGDMHSAVIDDAGNVWEWGHFYERDKDEISVRAYPVKTFQGAVAVATGRLNTLAITNDNILWGWGWNTFGLGPDYMNPDIYYYEAVQIMDNVAAVDICEFKIRILSTNGCLWIINWSAPTHKMCNVIDFSIGDGFTVVRRDDNTLWTFGRNSRGQLGDGSARTFLFQNEPRHIMNNVKSIETTFFGTVAVITKDGELWAWGDNFGGTLGNGTREESFYPIHILDNVVNVVNLTD